MANELVRVNSLSLVDAEPTDANYLKDHLRFLDQRECLIHGVTPLEALTDPFVVQGARTFTIKYEDEVIGMCGTVPIDSKNAKVWMLGSEGITKHWRSFLRGSEEVIKLLQGHYESIENYVPADHVDTVMWLQWCGFEFDDNLYDVSSHTMLRFIRCKKGENNVYYLRPRPVMH